jgi:hypothetical protein
MGSRIQLRRGKAAFWESENPILRDGEPGLETDTRRVKYGDGVTHWRELPYSSAGSVDLELPDDSALAAHIADLTPHPVYDDGPSLFLLYQNAKV